MLVRKKVLAERENELRCCRELLTSRYEELRTIRDAASGGGGIYKRILECREMAEYVRRLMPVGKSHDGYRLLDHLAYMDGWLRYLAATLPQDPHSHLLARAVKEGDVARLYHGTYWVRLALHQEPRA